MLQDEYVDCFLQTTVTNHYYQFDISNSPPSKRARIDLNVNPGGWYEQQQDADQNAANDDLCILSLGCHQSIDCTLQLGSLNWDQKPCIEGVSTSLTLCLPESSGRDEQNESQHGCHAVTASTSQEILSIDTDLTAEFAQLLEDMTELLKQKGAEIYQDYLKNKELQTASLADSIKRHCEQEIAKKDLELDAMIEKNKELMQKVSAAEDEVDKSRFVAWQSNEELNYLQAEFNKARQECGENDVMSHVSGDVEDIAMTKCRVCQEEEARILLLPCRHLSVCGGCNQMIDDCPICHSRKTESIDVIFP